MRRTIFVTHRVGRMAAAVIVFSLMGCIVHRHDSRREIVGVDDAAPFDIVPITQEARRRLTGVSMQDIGNKAAMEQKEGCSPTMANTDLLLPLHHKDMPLTYTLFKSIEMHVPCYKDLVIVVPPESEGELLAIAPKGAKLFVTPEPLPAGFGYLSQQMIKIYADKFTTGDHVLILEADLVFTAWNDECFFSEHGSKKVRAYCAHFEKDHTSPIWKKGTEFAIWRTVNHDCVISTPFIFPREVFKGLRDWIHAVHKKPIRQFMTNYFAGHSRSWTPDSYLFSEFNILNHYMINEKPELVEMITLSESPVKWKMLGQCSQHIGGLVKRIDNLENPKLTSDYFRIAHKHIAGTIAEHAKLTLDLRNSE